MRIPYLRLVDDEGARDATLEVIRQASKQEYELRGFEWPLVRRVMESRYNRMGDIGFIFGFTTVGCMRWAVNGPPVGRRALMMPIYSGFVIREFATAAVARMANTTRTRRMVMVLRRLVAWLGLESTAQQEKCRSTQPPYQTCGKGNTS